MPEQPSPAPDRGQIIRFRPRTSPSVWRWPASRAKPAAPPVADLKKYQHALGEDDYRHRMTMNVLALAVTIILVVIGVWLAVTIADMRKNQDCYLQGRPNCNQLWLPRTEL
jgi:hypothetical protein